MATGSKVRVYDLAKELKQDTKRIIEELRREGADIDVPSNSVSKELAEKIRSKYFPKVDSAPKRAIKIIKKEKPVTDGDIPVENELPEQPSIEEMPIEAVVEKVAKPAPPKESQPVKSADEVEIKSTVREIKLRKPLPVEEQKPIEPVVVKHEVSVEPVQTEVIEAVETETVASEAETKLEPTTVANTGSNVKVLAPKVIKPVGTSVRQLKLTSDALSKGFKPVNLKKNRKKFRVIEMTAADVEKLNSAELRAKRRLHKWLIRRQLMDAKNLVAIKVKKVLIKTQFATISLPNATSTHHDIVQSKKEFLIKLAKRALKKRNMHDWLKVPQFAILRKKLALRLATSFNFWLKKEFSRH
jgi:Translation initiation factor IF-2, N-terminal region